MKTAAETGSTKRRFGFGRGLRLARPEEFDDVFKSGRRFPGRSMVLLCLARGGGEVRLGVVTTKRTFRRAVDRVRVRRRLRELFRRNRPAFRGCADIVLIGRGRALSEEYVDLERDFRSLAVKAGILDRDAGG
ncbi:MAG: ribonuclease P protein component [Lentisphaerae bacterium]|nr:ribonuclease P protein component [Lentisphaerota bacterium]